MKIKTKNWQLTPCILLYIKECRTKNLSIVNPCKFRERVHFISLNIVYET